MEDDAEHFLKEPAGELLPLATLLRELFKPLPLGLRKTLQSLLRDFVEQPVNLRQLFTASPVLRISPLALTAKSSLRF
jgi:hypothetical protein